MCFVYICIYIFIIISCNIHYWKYFIYAFISNPLHIRHEHEHEHFNQAVPEQLLELCLDSV